MQLNAVQPAVEQRQTAQYGWLVIKQATYTATIFSCVLLLQWQNKLSYHREIQNLLCTVRIIITYCVSFPAAKEKRGFFWNKGEWLQSH